MTNEQNAAQIAAAVRATGAEIRLWGEQLKVVRGDQVSEALRASVRKHWKRLVEFLEAEPRLLALVESVGLRMQSLEIVAEEKWEAFRRLLLTDHTALEKTMRRFHLRLEDLGWRCDGYGCPWRRTEAASANEPELVLFDAE